ncbi:MAG: Xaa-Pro peptidase family protein [Alphaproteobacteria bacterium]|jgi:Xaa-Pro dipeptidase|nr:Xaa-Pro peptidase family protein [Alphaproteobacteria bacterium]
MRLAKTIALVAMASAPPSAPFESAEYEARIARARAGLREAGLDALLLFAQESLYYLTGFDSGGYVFFQAAVLTADDGPITLLTRIPDRAQAHATSVIPDIRVWLNAEDAKPAEDLKAIMAEKGLDGARVGVELNTYGLTGYNWELVRNALDGFCGLEDGSAIVRQAAGLADRALEAMIAAARPGVPDSALAAVCLEEILLGGGDVPPGGPLVNSGARAPFGRGVGGPRRLEAQDHVVVEFAATWRRYNACVERTIVLGPPPAKLLHMYEAAFEALAEMTAAARPGAPLGAIDEAHRRVFDAAGYAEQRFAACGYSLGATYRPTWMDVPPMLYAGNPIPAAPGMVLFLHAIIGDPDSGLAVGLGQTLLITEDGREVLNKVPLELHRR